MRPSTARDLYAVLGADPVASPEQLRAAYRRAARLAHPDTGGSADAFQRLQAAWATLSDPHSRATYDAGDPQADASEPVGEPTAEPADEPWGTDDDVRPAHDTAPPDAPWGVEDDVAPPPAQQHDRRGKTATSERVRRHGRLTAALALLLVAAFTTWWAVTHTTSGAATVAAAVAMSASSALRALRRRGRFALALEVLVLLAVVVGPDVGPPDVVAVTVLTAGELTRSAVRSRALARQRARHRAAQASLAADWDRMIATARTHGRLAWLMQTQPLGTRTSALVQDWQTGAYETLWLWGRWSPGWWVVVDAAGAVHAHCADTARAAWAESQGARR